MHGTAVSTNLDAAQEAGGRVEVCWERTGGTPTARAQLLTPLAVLFVKSDLNHAKRGEDRRGVEIKRRKRSSGHYWKNAYSSAAVSTGHGFAQY